MIKELTEKLRYRLILWLLPNSPLTSGKTNRGFGSIPFRCSDGKQCSITKSSSAERDLIWFGADKIGLKRFYPYQSPSWRDVDLSDSQYIANNSVQLSPEKIKELLPFLVNFAVNGTLKQ